MSTDSDARWRACMQERQHADTVLQTVRARHAAVQAQAEAAEEEVRLLKHCEAGFSALLDALSHESLTAVESLLTYGLRTVFPTQGLSCRLVASTKRGQQSVAVHLLQEVEGTTVDAPILEAFGGGPGSVVSFLLRLLVIRRAHLAPVILLDESFAFVAQAHIDGVATLLRDLADRLQLTIVLVTHQPAFLAVATEAYQIDKVKGRAVFTPVHKQAAS